MHLNLLLLESVQHGPDGWSKLDLNAKQIFDRRCGNCAGVLDANKVHAMFLPVAGIAVAAM
jgi:hypothetical protein